MPLHHWILLWLAISVVTFFGVAMRARFVEEEPWGAAFATGLLGVGLMTVGLIAFAASKHWKLLQKFRPPRGG